MTHRTATYSLALTLLTQCRIAVFLSILSLWFVALCMCWISCSIDARFLVKLFILKIVALLTRLYLGKCFCYQGCKSLRIQGLQEVRQLLDDFLSPQFPCFPSACTPANTQCSLSPFFPMRQLQKSPTNKRISKIAWTPVWSLTDVHTKCKREIRGQ